MKPDAREWLPAEALVDAAAQAAVAGAVEDWSATWLPGPPLKSLGFRVREPRAAQLASRPEWHIHATVTAIAHVPEVMSALVRRGLAAAPSEAVVEDADRELVAGFVQRMLGDLALKLEQALMIEGKQHGAPRPVPDPIGPSGALVISVGAREAGAFELSVAIPLDALVAFRKRRIARGGREAGRLDSLSGAVANTELTIEASLGEAELSLAELRGLAAGDVVVLDRSCTDPAMLSLRGSPRAPFATGSLSGTGDSISLILDK